VPASGALARGEPRSEESLSLKHQTRQSPSDHMRDFFWPQDQTVRKSQSSSMDWGTGGLHLQAERSKLGSKKIAIGSTAEEWRRTYAASAEAWQTLAQGLAFGAGARIERTRSGTTGGPLVTRPTRSVSQEAYVAIQVGRNSIIRISAFDRGGWSTGAIDNVINRLTNGERPASKGLALEIGRSAILRERGNRPSQFKLRLERSATPMTGAATTAGVSWKLQF